MAGGIRVDVRRKNTMNSGIAMLSRKLREVTEERVLAHADVAMRAAVDNTPKWSGQATRGWTFKGESGGGYTVSSDDWNDLVYEGGIDDPKAKHLNSRVKADRMRTARAIVARQIRAGKDVKLYLVNNMGYSATWLTDSSQIGVSLRAVNADYWTLQDIMNEVKQQMSVKYARW